MVPSPHLACARRDGAEQDPRIVHRRPVNSVELEVIPEEEAVPAGSLGYDGELSQHGRVASVGHAHTESHGGLSTNEHRHRRRRTI
jgi:hypothetical protein